MAKKKNTKISVSQEAHAEMHLGEIATKREQYEEALSRYQLVTELEPDLSDSWSDLADVYDHLRSLDEAETHYCMDDMNSLQKL